MSMYVIAGVTGHVGSVVAEELLAKGARIKVIVRDAAKGAAWSKRGAEIAVGSLDDAGFLTGALKGATAFFALIPPNLTTPQFYAYQRRVADAIVSGVKASGVPHVVLLSSTGADLADRVGPVKALHRLENELRATGVKLTALRPGFFQENVAMNVAPARQASIYPSFGPVDFPLPMIATRDVARVAAQALVAPAAKSEVVDIQGPAYSTRQLAEKLGAALGKKLQIMEIPPQGHVAALTQAGVPQELAEAYAELNAAFAAGVVTLKGDRAVAGSTTIDEVLPALIRA